jgi:hypothetical protein
MSLQFTAEHSLGTEWSHAADRVRKQPPAIRRSKTDDRGRVLPQLTVTGCGSPTLNSACFGFASPAWLPCELHFWWNQGAAGSCMYWSMVGVAPGCARCTVVAP